MRIFKTFRIQIIIRTILLCFTIYALVYFQLRLKLPITALCLTLFIIFQLYSIIRFVEKNNRRLNQFLTAIEHDDFSGTIVDKGMGPSFRELADAVNNVMTKIRQSRADTEAHYRYLQIVVHHVGIGLITFRSDGKVELINNAAKRLLNVNYLNDINALENFSANLRNTLLSIRAGQKALVKVKNGEMVLALHAVEFTQKNQKYTLVSIQDIESELQENEMEAWQKLIRVLTHEIMNSMTPISSMSATVIDLLDQLYTEEGPFARDNVDDETFDDIMGALKTIHKRSLGLTHFVSAYRDLTLIPTPSFKVIAVRELFTRVERLMELRFKEAGIAYESAVEPHTLELTADPGLIEQVLINLLINAVDASGNCPNPRILLTAGLDGNGKIAIRVTDNGQGIVWDALAKVFIPFFTTKRKGSGIGLSLSRQIMKLHNGSITVHSVPDTETIFTLKF
ncbi:MAG: ATP-binding protein [bacterium]|nr:ATP-binding protein [bacterium]